MNAAGSWLKELQNGLSYTKTDATVAIFALLFAPSKVAYVRKPGNYRVNADSSAPPVRPVVEIWPSLVPER